MWKCQHLFSFIHDKSGCPIPNFTKDMHTLLMRQTNELTEKNKQHIWDKSQLIHLQTSESLCRSYSGVEPNASSLDDDGYQTQKYKNTKHITLKIAPPTHNHFTALWILSGITQVSRYQKGKTNLDFTEAREWVAMVSVGPYASLHLITQTDNHTSTPTLSFYRPDAFPAAQPTVSKHWRHILGML